MSSICLSDVLKNNKSTQRNTDVSFNEQGIDVHRRILCGGKSWAFFIATMLIFLLQLKHCHKVNVPLYKENLLVFA